MCVAAGTEPRASAPGTRGGPMQQDAARHIQKVSVEYYCAILFRPQHAIIRLDVCALRDRAILDAAAQIDIYG